MESLILRPRQIFAEWLTTDININEGESIGQVLINRLKTLGDEGRMFGSKPADFENTTREITQEWQALTSDEVNNMNESNFVSAERTYGETKVIKQTYHKGKDDWHIKGKSYHWQPTVGDHVYEKKLSGS